MLIQCVTDISILLKVSYYLSSYDQKTLDSIILFLTTDFDLRSSNAEWDIHFLLDY